MVESRSQFTNATQFFGSRDYFDQLGLDGGDVLANIDRQVRLPNEAATRILGDSFIETKLILDRIKALTNDSLFLIKTSNEEAQQTANQEVKKLIDDSVAEMARLGLNAETVAINGLTKDQANSLIIMPPKI